MRVAAEVANLPEVALSWGSSIFVRTEEASMDLMRAFIVGPADTPYANGWLGFDIKLPSAYPDVPPKVLFTTTGGGRCRLNPNLYAEGKVCLSLLGTWAGPGWTKGVSTLSQVLLSIQAQILVEKPYANEPSFESKLGSASGRRAVAMHNAQLRLATLRHGMVDVLRAPPRGFERAAALHFFLKRDELRAQAARWLADAAGLARHERALELRWRAAHGAWRAAEEAEAAAREELRRWHAATEIPVHAVFGWRDGAASPPAAQPAAGEGGA
jgi:ubiquitin-protein ligase